MAKVMIALSHTTAHVLDEERSVPPEFGPGGQQIGGKLVPREVPPRTPFELEEADADALLSKVPGVRIPPGEQDPVAWLAANFPR